MRSANFVVPPSALRQAPRLKRSCRDPEDDNGFAGGGGPGSGLIFPPPALPVWDL